jgi:long-chain acyl-CoA synthetase
VRRHVVLRTPFEVGSGLLTPTLKVRRRAVQQLYSREIEAMYAA